MMRKRIMAALLALLCLCLAGQALAMEPINLKKDCKIVLHAVYGELPIPGATFRAYRVADVSEMASYKLTEDFAATGISVNSLTTVEAMTEASETFAALVESDSPTQIAMAVTDNTGTVTFAGLTPGLYIILGEECQLGNYIYSFLPSMIPVPHIDENDVWQYESDSLVKISRRDVEMDLEIYKVWEDGNNTKYRPKEIKINVLCDGEVAYRLTLNEENGWHATLTGLSVVHEWTVQEPNVPTYYEVEYDDKKEGQILIVNKLTPPSTTPPNIPQTGMIWWPVLLLAGVGLILFLSGWVMHHQWKKEQKK